MTAPSFEPAAVAQTTQHDLAFSGHWTALAMEAVQKQAQSVYLAAGTDVQADASRIEAVDTIGAWMLLALMQRLRTDGATVALRGLKPELARLFEVVAQQFAAVQAERAASTLKAEPAALERIGRSAAGAGEQGVALLGFLGETGLALARSVAHPARWRLRPLLFNIRGAGFDALPIVGLLAFLLGVVVAYQGADQLRQYGANIFVADLVGLSMLREFAPLITAIIVAGRSGSAYAAQIGTMAVTEELDAMQTLGIVPMELLVLPKVLALTIALPLLTVFADLLGVLGGMLMAHSQLNVGYGEFLDRFVKAISPTAYLIGICKAPVFAVIIVVIGCFQGFRTHGGADSVGRQTTRSVVQSIFLVIVADALFSVVFSLLDL